jgi:chromosome segregation ATPase
MDLRMKHRIFPALLALAVSLPAAAGRNYEGFLLPDQVLQCLRDHGAVSALNRQLSAEKERLAAEAADIARVEEDLVRQQADIAALRRGMVQRREDMRVPATDLDKHLAQVKAFNLARESFDAKVAAYNAGVNAQQARREPHNRAVIALNTQLEQLRVRSAEVDARCTGKRSYKEDIEAAKQKLAEEAAQR